MANRAGEEQKGSLAEAWIFLRTFVFFALPAAVIYMNCALFNCNPFRYGRNFGYLNYMTLHIR